jgi:isoquinoline 1-oxidoreductase alpha subunit
VSVSFTLNGRPTTLSSPPETKLLWALRDEAKLTGVKFGCGIALCGACTVLVDGQQTRSCQSTIDDVAGKNVVTIEGLSGDVADAVIEAWIGAAVPQCGYCQPGFVVAVTSVIANDRKQTAESVLQQITNICRCGTYDAIRGAVGKAIERLAGGEDGGAR